MTYLKVIKAIVVAVWALCALFCFALFSPSQQFISARAESTLTKLNNHKPEDFVGTETCKACHTSHFNSFSKTTHAKLASIPSWKDKVHGCESCHGPGKEHVDLGGDRSKIRTFDKASPKEISETCLACHAGSEEHNNFRRGEHWRNDVGCVDCHSPHPPEAKLAKADSLTFIAEASRHKPDVSTIKMLRTTEQQLCLKCHTEMKSQFNMPFHHKVLEGAMKCSDCHNPHGGFEQKQTRLATGADAVCIKCHTDKQGPFVYEHPPIKLEGCTACHTPHGANNPKLLKRSAVRQLCLECHTNAHETGAPNTPNFHNQATARFQNCTTCHARIHGSQSHPFFFR